MALLVILVKLVLLAKLVLLVFLEINLTLRQLVQ